MESKIFKQDAKSIVDIAFDKRLFKEEVTRDDMDAFQTLIEQLMEMRFESYKKGIKFAERLEKINKSQK